MWPKNLVLLLKIYHWLLKGFILIWTYICELSKGCNSGRTEHINLELSRNDKRVDQFTKKTKLHANTATTIAAFTATTTTTNTIITIIWRKTLRAISKIFRTGYYIKRRLQGLSWVGYSVDQKPLLATAAVNAAATTDTTNNNNTPLLLLLFLLLQILLW